MGIVSAYIFGGLIKVVWKEGLHKHNLCGYKICVGRTSAEKEVSIIIRVYDEMVWEESLNPLLMIFE